MSAHSTPKPILDVYSSTSSAQEGLQQRVRQSGALGDVELRWHPVPDDWEPHTGAAHDPPIMGGGSPRLSSFRGPLYMRALNRSGRMGQTLVAAYEMGSTQEFMRANLVALGDGVVLVADKQTAGKGRGGNTWTSPAGCLMFSTNRRLSIPPAQAPYINYVVCLGVVQGLHDAVADVCGQDAPRLPISIKWPNDVYYTPPPASTSTHAGATTTESGTAGVSESATPLKIAGALIHTSWSGSSFNVMTGIGLNLSNTQPTTCVNAVLREAWNRSHSGKEEGGMPASGGAGSGGTLAGCGSQQPECPQVSQEVALAHIMNRLDECFQVFEERGFAPLEAPYLSNWMHTGQRIQFADGGDKSVQCGERGSSGQQQAQSDATVTGGAVPTTITTLSVQGLSPSGFLLAEEEGSGRVYELTPDGNSLDMMSGLVRRKL